eukprot:Gb_11810 [translate_table: standard]
MPGSIRVSVLETVDLPAEATGEKYVSIKVAIGKREFRTKPSKADGDKTIAWNSEFAFPVLNLRDNLMVILLDGKDNAIAQTDIGTPSIVEKGYWDELFPLKCGGHIHLRLSFVLTEEERKRIEAMREAAMKRKEHAIFKKNATVEVLQPAAENRKSASVSSMSIFQSSAKDWKSKEGSDNKDNQVAAPLVPELSQSNDARLRKEKIEEASEGSSVASISPAFKHANNKEASSKCLKKTSGHDLPLHDLVKVGTTLPYEEHIPSKEFSSPSSQMLSPFEEAQNKGVVQANSTILNQELQPAPLPTEGSFEEGCTESEYQEIPNVIDKLPIIGSGEVEAEKKDTTSELSEHQIMPEVSSQVLVAIHGTGQMDSARHSLQMVNEGLSSSTITSYPPQSLNVHGSNFSASEFHTEAWTSHVPLSEETSVFTNAKATNLASSKCSYEDNMAASSLITSPSVLPLQSSSEGLISPTPLVDTPPDAVGGLNIPSSSILSKKSQTDQMFQKHESVNTAESLPVPIVCEPTTSQKNILIVSHSDSHFESGTMQASEEMCMAQPLSSVASSENTDILIQDIYPAPSVRTDSPDMVLPSDPVIGSIAGSSAQVLCEDSSLQKVPSQTTSTEKGMPESVSSDIINVVDNIDGVLTPLSSAVNSQVDTIPSESASLPNPVESQTIKGNGTQSSVKAKIKAFETSLLQDLDHHVSPPVKSQNHKIEAERAVQRLRAEAAAAEAAEARRRAEEEEARLKSVTEEQVRKIVFHKRLEESRFRRAAKVKRKYLERNEEEGEREIQEVKEITVDEQDVRNQEACRGKEEVVQKAEEKRPEQGEIKENHAREADNTHLVYKALVHGVSTAERKLPKSEGNRQPEDLIALNRYSEEQEKNLLRPIETEEKMAEEDPRQKTLLWERMRLGELQSKKKRRDKSEKSESPVKKNEVGHKLQVDASVEVSWSGKTSKEKQDRELQVAKNQLMKDETRRFAQEARRIIAEKGKAERYRRIQNESDIIDTEDAKAKTKQRQGNDPDFMFETKVQSLVPESGNSFSEHKPGEEGSTISEEEELQDLLKESKALGGFIKQALGAAAVLAAGALFMWVRGERMNRRRAGTTQIKDQHYFIQKGEESSSILRGQSEDTNARISKPKSKDLLYPGEHLILL